MKLTGPSIFEGSDDRYVLASGNSMYGVTDSGEVLPHEITGTTVSSSSVLSGSLFGGADTKYVLSGVSCDFIFVVSPPAPGSRPDPMIFLPIPWHHPLAGTSRSWRRTSFIPASISAGTAPRTISQSARRLRRQPPVRNHRRLSALSNLKETISRQRRCRAKSP